MCAACGAGHAPRWVKCGVGGGPGWRGECRKQVLFGGRVTEQPGVLRPHQFSAIAGSRPHVDGDVDKCKTS